MPTDRLGNVHGSDGRFQRKQYDDDDLEDFTNAVSEREACIEFAKRSIIDLIWKSSCIEVNGLTFPETQEIFKGRNPDGMDDSTKDIIVVNNIKHAWQYLFEQADNPIDWRYLCDYNSLCGKGVEPDPGRIRTTPVRISGTNWKPSGYVSLDDVFRELDEVKAESTPIRQAERLFAVVCKGQWFNNGNKRTAVLAANHTLIHSGQGVFTLPPQRMDSEFRAELLHYYETDDLERFLTSSPA